MSGHTITPPDLGNIIGVKVGDKVATLHLERGRWVAMGLRPVTTVDGDTVWMKRDKFLKSVGPWGYYFMSRRERPDFYYSANPVHIEAAERKAWAESVERDRLASETAARRAAAEPLGDLFGDGERHDSYGDSYGDTPATDALAERLTVEQIETLKSWMGL